MKSDYDEKTYGWNWLWVVLGLIGFGGYFALDYVHTERRCRDIGREISQKIDDERRRVYLGISSSSLFFKKNQDLGDTTIFEVYLRSER